jgi:hypothetical protein
MSRKNINILEKQLNRVTTKSFKQHSKYFGHLVFHLQKPRAVVARVFSYDLLIIIIFVLNIEEINSEEFSAFFAGLQQVT